MDTSIIIVLLFNIRIFSRMLVTIPHQTLFPFMIVIHTYIWDIGYHIINNGI